MSANLRMWCVRRVGVFGSFRHDAAREDSDVDLLVEFEPGQKTLDRKRGQCGLAMPRTLVGGNPTWVTASHGPSIEPCCASGNRRADA